jgi:hypothetical protein
VAALYRAAKGAGGVCGILWGDGAKICQSLSGGVRKDFFFEKKKQKTFANGPGLSGSVRQVTKVLWFFFSKKNCFLG